MNPELGLKLPDVRGHVGNEDRIHDRTREPGWDALGGGHVVGDDDGARPVLVTRALSKAMF